MAITYTQTDGLQFPQRRDDDNGIWAPVYIEPMVGSGERITIAVVAFSDRGDFEVVPVSNLNRLECVYGTEVQPLLFAQHFVIQKLESDLQRNAETVLSGWEAPLDGIEIGTFRPGAGKDLADIAKTGLLLSSSLSDIKIPAAAHAHTEAEPDTAPVRNLSTLDKAVRKIVLARQPTLADAFGKQFRPNDDVRPTVVGFVGKRIAANFVILRPKNLSQCVDRAKAKLWDLGQLQEYVSDPIFGLSDELNRFELLVDRVRRDDPEYSERQLRNADEAFNELEFEADKKEIRCRGVQSPTQIADTILDVEAA